MSYGHRKKLLPYLLLAPSVAVLVTIGVYPFIYSVVLSTGSAVLTKPWLPSRFVGFENYQRLATDPYFVSTLVTTIVFTVTVVALQFALGLGLALLLERTFKGRGLVRSLLIVPMVTTPIIVGLIWKSLLYPQYGFVTYYGSVLQDALGIQFPVWLENKDWALFTVAMVDVWHWTPFMFLVLSAGLASLPRAPLEAAKVDGASPWQTFMHVTLPLLKPAVFVCLIIRTMDAFRVFDKVYALTQGGPSNVTEVLSIYLYRLTFRFFYISRGAAAAIFMLMIIFATSWVAVKTFRKKEAF